MLEPKLISPPTSAISRVGYVAGTAWRDARLASCTRRLLKRASLPTKSASGRSRTKVAKAASISRPVLALKTWICSPMARAASSTSRNVLSAFRGGGRIDEHGHTSRSGHQLTQELQPLCHQLTTEKIDTRHVAARAGKAGDKTEPHRVFVDGEDDGDRRSCRLGSQRRIGTSGHRDHRDPSANQIGRQRREPIDLILGPAVFNQHILTLDNACVFEALTECADALRHPVRRSGVEESDHWHRRLLRAHRERPGHRRAPEQRDELAAPHRCNHSITSSARTINAIGTRSPIALAAL